MIAEKLLTVSWIIKKLVISEGIINFTTEKKLYLKILDFNGINLEKHNLTLII